MMLKIYANLDPNVEKKNGEDRRINTIPFANINSWSLFVNYSYLRKLTRSVPTCFFHTKKKLMTMYLRVNFKISVENLFQQKFGAILMLKILFIEIPSTVFWAEESKTNAWHKSTNEISRFLSSPITKQSLDVFFLIFTSSSELHDSACNQDRYKKSFFLHCERFLRLVRNDDRKLKD